MVNRGYIAIAAAVLVVVIGAATLIWKPEIEKAEAPDSKVDVADQALVRQGWSLAQLGNCASCHTADGGAAYAGGRPIITPFGKIYASNITPDPETGIGTWREKAFLRAMREGVDREGRHLYPAFPYNFFTKTSDDDLTALYVYLRTLAPVKNTQPPNDLSFPFNIRPLMAGWNMLFLDDQPLAPIAGKGDAWNRGRYLVDSIAHCGACHTPRNALGAVNSSEKFEGASIEGWLAPALVGNTSAPWSAEGLQHYLATGWSSDHGAAAGPMAEAVVNLARVPPSDLHAIAVYIADLNGGTQSHLANIINASAQASESTKAIYAGSCANCHESGRRVGPSKALPLSAAASLRYSEPENAAGIIVNGISAYRSMGGPFMPAFGDILTDSQIADLLVYLRQRYSDEPEWVGIAETVSAARKARETDHGR